MTAPRFLPGVSARTLLLAGVNVALLALLASLLLDGPDVPRAKVSGDTLLVSASELEVPPRAENLTVVSAQPVFHKTRQFFQPPDPAAASLRPPPPNYQFAGAMLIPGKQPLAYLKSAQSSQTIKVQTGQALEGWTVQAIERRAVILAFEGETITIGNAQASPSGIVAVAPRTASSEAPSTGGVRVLGSSAPVTRPVASSSAVTPARETKPRTYQPPPT